MTINLTFYYQHPKTEINSLGIGVFDGVHLGHQQITDQVDTILTFNPHPATIINPNISIPRLTTPQEMLSYVNQVACLSFNSTIASMSAESFLNEIILKKLAPKKIVVGYDYFFGANRKGTPEYLKEWGKKNDIDIVIIDPFSKEKTLVKSKIIRQLFLDDKFSNAVSLLGHPYLIEGVVIKGDQRGTSLGFPTANIKVLQEKLIPPKGVYKGFVKLNQKIYMTYIYIGTKPTFNGQSNTVEAYIDDFSGNLYGKKIGIHIEKFIRKEIKFNSSEDLITQIKLDLRKN